MFVGSFTALIPLAELETWRDQAGKIRTASEVEEKAA